MKSVNAILWTIIAVGVLYVFGYWMLYRQGYVFMLPVASSDPFGTSGLRRAIDEIFEPAREVDLRLTLDAPLQRRLLGYWRSTSNDDFVTITPDLACKFQLGRFKHEGTVKYDRLYAGYFTEFRLGDVTYNLIFSCEADLHSPPLPEHVAIAFVSHDPKPGYREGDYVTQLTKQAEPGAEANRLPTQ